MACESCEITKFERDNGVDFHCVTKTSLSAHGDETITVELAPSGYDVKSLSHHSRSRGGRIAKLCNFLLGSINTF